MLRAALQLHNNTSPDDVVICEALLAYINADLDIAAYWNTLLVSDSTLHAIELAARSRVAQGSMPHHTLLKLRMRCTAFPAAYGGAYMRLAICTRIERRTFIASRPFACVLSSTALRS